MQHVYLPCYNLVLERMWLELDSSLFNFILLGAKALTDVRRTTILKLGLYLKSDVIVIHTPENDALEFPLTAKAERLNSSTRQNSR